MSKDDFCIIICLNFTKNQTNLFLHIVADLLF